MLHTPNLTNIDSILLYTYVIVFNTDKIDRWSMFKTILKKHNEQ